MITDADTLEIKDNKSGKLLTGFESVTHQPEFL